MNRSIVLKADFSISLKKRYFYRFLYIVVFLFSIVNKGMAQHATYNLADLKSKGLFIMENRSMSPLTEKHAVRFSSADGSGVAWLKNVEFSNGTIEVDLRGKDIKQGSFLGIAFHGVSKDSCEAIYFRPFNFLSKDSLQQAHMVQYVFDPAFGWERLRNEHPGVYEKKLQSPPAPNDWFHIKIVVKGKIIKVYVNNSTESCLEVSSLNEKMNGKLGLWVGNSSAGDFANLVVN